ncbi:MAG: type II/IV secretion system protein [Xanthomonadales bacterium]|nr:type II/IV secretion system protein [Xanthomonadales bacterium]
MTRDIHTIEPPLLADAAALDSYLETYPNVYAEQGYPAVSLASWHAFGEDAGEPAYATAQRLGLPLVRLEHISAETDALGLIPPDLARRLRAVPLRVCKGMVAVAMEDPGGPDAQRLLDFLSRERVLPLVASPLQIREAISRHYDQVEDRAMARQLGLDTDADQQSPNEQEAQRLALEMPVVSMVHTLIADAVSRRASDIHLRPGEDATDVLYRIDDELVPVRRLGRALNPAVVSRIKVLAGMNLAEHRRPQDGRTTFRIDSRRTVDLRISLLPTVFGESIVVRLLDTTESLWNLDQLGLSESDRQRIEDVMARSHGMFLATGPTGCGKSTTLYAMLLELRKQRINILTIEDPVEFHIADIQQMQVNRAAGFTFASAMRNFLRHDPDVIMVGEIRDRETADIAVESALTGHLMLSTLHTNTAATTVTRLLDLGVEAYLLRTSLLAVISQRLVRLTCPHCRTEEAVHMHMREELGVGADEVFHIGRGCHRCEGLGVFRRQAVYELMVITPRLRQLIVPSADADALHAAAIVEGMIPITRAAVALARSGVISLAEAWRVRAD